MNHSKRQLLSFGACMQIVLTDGPVDSRELCPMFFAVVDKEVSGGFPVV
jgi:hypothetical protein